MNTSQPGKGNVTHIEKWGYYNSRRLASEVLIECKFFARSFYNKKLPSFLSRYFSLDSKKKLEIAALPNSLVQIVGRFERWEKEQLLWFSHQVTGFSAECLQCLQCNVSNGGKGGRYKLKESVWNQESARERWERSSSFSEVRTPHSVSATHFTDAATAPLLKGTQALIGHWAEPSHGWPAADHTVEKSPQSHRFLIWQRRSGIFTEKTVRIKIKAWLAQILKHRQYLYLYFSLHLSSHLHLHLSDTTGADAGTWDCWPDVPLAGECSERQGGWGGQCANATQFKAVKTVQCNVLCDENNAQNWDAIVMHCSAACMFNARKHMTMQCKSVQCNVKYAKQCNTMFSDVIQHYQASVNWQRM